MLQNIARKTKPNDQMAFITGRSSINLRDLKCKRPRMSNLTKEDTMSKETGASQSSNLVVINVAGKKFETFEDTLARFPDTLLGDPTKRRPFLNPKTGEYFFDRNRSAFSGILYYYQSNGILECPAKVSESLFTKEVLFFELGESLLGIEEDENGLEKVEEEELPKNKILRKIWILFEHPNSSIIAKCIAVFSVLVILISIVVFCIETLPQLDPNQIESKERKAKVTLTWNIINTFCNVWFTLEYLLRLIAAEHKLKFIRSTINVIDLMSIIPFYLSLIIDEGGGIDVLRVIRVIRVVRIFKLTRHSRGLHILGNTIHASLHELAMLALFLFIGVILFSSAVYYAESQVLSKDFPSIPHAFWWAVVTMTTVGYGDITPVTFIGKLVGAMCAISGVLVIALPVPVIVSNFEHYYKEEKARQARLEEKERKRSEPKVEPHFFPANSPAHSSLAGEEKSIFHKFRRLPSIVRKFSVTSNTNGQANIEHNEEKLSKQPENRPEDALAEEKSINTIIAESDQENEEKYAEEDSVQVNLIKKDREDDSETRL
ncbi:shaker-related potassium channel tsha2-like isoform X2 [Rhopilema esculentum]|uniref:shaker-related potassium channel tsha2-like isoform X2 n=1 Tax=Rhopilema esculentum TaxID=499914 RepID=UPI0031CF72B7